MYRYFRSVTHTMRVLYVLLLLALCVGCSPLPSNPTMSPPLVSVTSTAIGNPGVISFNSRASTDFPVLYIQTEGIYCIPRADELLTGSLSSTVTLPRSNLVLATEQLSSYKLSQIQEIKAYLQLNYNNGGNYNYWQPPPSPATLRWVQGGDLCIGDFQITNTGVDPLQVTSFGAQLIDAPQNNTYQYRQVDICLRHADCQQGGGQGQCEYEAQIQLNRGARGTLFSGQIESTQRDDPACPVPLTLSRHASSDVLVFFSEARKQALIYHINPELITSTGPYIISRSSFPSTLVFANDKQFSCYRLQDDASFVLEKPQPINVNTTWCI